MVYGVVRGGFRRMNGERLIGTHLEDGRYSGRFLTVDGVAVIASVIASGKCHCISPRIACRGWLPHDYRP
jgi:hypothetical protein